MPKKIKNPKKHKDADKNLKAAVMRFGFAPDGDPRVEILSLGAKDTNKPSGRR